MHIDLMHSFSLSRNQLSNIPPFISQLQALEVLIACNNRLVSLPEEIGQLEKLMELVRQNATFQTNLQENYYSLPLF